MRHHPKQWMQVRPEGLYCVPGDFYIDPLNSVKTAVITHGHSDHARVGHHKIIATAETVAIMQARYGDKPATELLPISYFEKFQSKKVQCYLLPAGHILGSAQIVIEYKDVRLIISGDYKRAADPTCLPFQAEPCDVFITEATFGLPVFNHPPITEELTKLLASLNRYPNSCHLVGAYALGKCQRIIKCLRMQGYTSPIYLHGALLKLCDLYQTFGVQLGELIPASQLDKASSGGKLVLCPPSALHDRWTRRFENVIIANASGWMQVRARAKQKGIDLPLIVSDHADWQELVMTLHEVNPAELWVTHGREDALVYYATQKGIYAQALNILGYEEEGGGSDE